jgi:hypothetical protein
MSTCTSCKSLPPVSTLAWLGLASRASMHVPLLKQTHQGRNDGRLPGHDAAWTGHSTAQQSRVPCSTQPRNCTSLSRYNSLWTSGQSAVHPAVHHRLRSTWGLFATQQYCSTLQPIPLGESPVADTKTKHGILATAL